MRPLDQKLPIINSQMQFKENGLSIPIKPQKSNQRNLTAKVTIVSSAISTLGLAYLAYQYYRKKGYWPNIIPLASGPSLKNIATMSVIGAFGAAMIYFSKKTGFKFFVNSRISANHFPYFLSNVELLERFEETKKLFYSNEPDFETEFNKIINYLKTHGIDSNETLIYYLINFIKDEALYKFSLGTGTPLIAGIVKAVFFELLSINKHKALEIAIACVEEQKAEYYSSCQDIITATMNNQDLAVKFAIACADRADKSDWCQEIAKNALSEFLKMDTKNQTTLTKKYVMRCTKRDHDICQNAVIEGFNAILAHNKNSAADIAMACVDHLFSTDDRLRKENKNVVFYVCEQLRIKKFDKETNESFLKVAIAAAKSLSSEKIETLIDSIEGIRRPKYQKEDAFHILAIKFQDLIRSYLHDRSRISLGLAYLWVQNFLDSKNEELQTFAEQTIKNLKDNGMENLQNKITEESKENNKLTHSYSKYLSF